MEKVAVDRELVLSCEQDEMQKYIEVFEENLELRNILPFHVKRLVTENENLKTEA